MSFPEGMPGPYDLKADDSVQPGDTYVYIWNITYQMRSGAFEDECNPWLLHSQTYNLQKDVHSGPVGVLMTCFKDHLLGTGKLRHLLFNAIKVLMLVSQFSKRNKFVDIFLSDLIVTLLLN